MCSLSLAFLFIPSPNSTMLIDIYGRMGILEDTYFAREEVFPMFSSHQFINANIYAVNGSFTFMVMEEDEFNNWVEDRPYSALFISSNLTQINEKFEVSALNKWPYLRCSVVIKPDYYLVITGKISTQYLDHYYVIAFISLALGSLALIYYFWMRITLKKKSINNEKAYFSF